MSSFWERGSAVATTLRVNWSYLRRLLSPLYLRHRRAISSLKFSSPAEYRQLQLHKLRQVLVHAYEHVPYYRDSFGKAGVNPYRLKSLDHFREYPILTREEYRINHQAFIASNVKRSSIYHRYTGGTTGQPLRLPRQLRDDARELAYTHHIYDLLGVATNARKLLLRGPVEDAIAKYVRFEELRKTMRLSTSNMTDSNLENYLRRIRAFGPQLVYAVPSSLAILCHYMERQGLPRLPSVRWVFTQSEMLYEFQERLIERVFKVPVFTSYGQAEHVVSAWRCQHSRLYHVLPYYGYTELLDSRGNPIQAEAQSGRVIGTGFAGYCAPLIRYDTGDWAIPARRACSCGTLYSSWETVEGRRMSLVYTKSGGHACLGPMLLCHLFAETHRTIRRFGIEQRRPGELIVTVVPINPGDGGEATSFLRHALEEEYPGLFDIRFVVEDNPPPTKAEKHLFLRQYVIKEELTPFF